MALLSNSKRSLSDRIWHAQVTSKFADSRECFLPHNELDNLVTKNAVKEEMPDAGEDLLTFTLQNAKRVFAIAVMCEIEDERLEEAMKIFMHAGFCDESLPIKNPKEDDPDYGDPPLCFGRCRAFTRITRLHSFYKNQWIFLAPVFTTTTFRYSLPVNSVLPFIWKDTTVKSGTFGQVFEGEIHPDHQDDLRNEDGSRARVAVKELRPDDEELQKQIENNWETELKALQEISKKNHPHIVKFVAAFEKGGKRYLILQWANGGNLREYWDKFEWKGLNSKLMEEALEQLHGLADGLQTLHNYKSKDDGYRHGDLKPENILRCKKSADDQKGLGILKIADMGLAKRHPFATAQRMKGTSTRFGTARYEPPEALYSLLPRSRLYDVWSMGCIALEYLIWLLYGNEELNRFHENVRGNHTKDLPLFMTEPGERGHKISIRPAVEVWMNHMAKDPECQKDTASRALLELVRERLLVIALNPTRRTATNMMDSNHSLTGSSAAAVSIEGEDIEIRTNSGPPFRASAQELQLALKSILDRSRNDRHYLFTGRARTNLRGPLEMGAPPSMLSPNDMRGLQRSNAGPDNPGAPDRSLAVPVPKIDHDIVSNVILTLRGSRV